MKKTTYAICGTVMVLAAVFARVAWEGGPELVGLRIGGIVTLIASVDLPQQHQKGRAR